jgi:hypothetical protein
MGLETALILGAGAVAGLAAGKMFSKKQTDSPPLPDPQSAPVAPIQALDEASKSAQSAQASQMSLMRGLQSTWNNQSMMTSKAGFANTSTPKSSTLG